MNVIYQSAFLRALGWSLVDSLWQMGILWLLLVTVTGNGRRYSAAHRHSLAVVALILGAAFFSISILLNYNRALHSYSSGGNIFDQLAPYMSCCYLLILISFFFNWLRAYRNTKALHLAAVTEAEVFEPLLNDLKKITSITREVRIWFSDRISSPLTTGVLKPVILFPVAAFNQLTLRQAEALIVHEFFHIRRNDYLVNIFTSLTEMVFFFNPFARLLLQAIKSERENSCDDEVLRMGYANQEYAEALYMIGKSNAENYQFAMAARGTGPFPLLQRIKRIMKQDGSGPPLLKPLFSLILCTALAGSAEREGVQLDPGASATVLMPPDVIEVSGPGSSAVVTEVMVVDATRDIGRSNVAPQKARSGTGPEASELPSEPTQETITEDIFIASYVSSKQQPAGYSFNPATVEDFQLPESARPDEPYLPHSTFYFPTHDMPDQEEGKSTIRL